LIVPVLRFINSLQCFLYVRWQGIGAVIDVTNPDAVVWYTDRLRQFQHQYGIDSFKFDAGEVGFLPQRRRMKSGSKSNDFSTSYAKMAADFGTAIEVSVALKT
jgi:myogenesis-regulating glycosidase